MSVKLSVVVPVYNTEKYLRECLDSLIHQTFHDMEIILVDNKSTDFSGAICDEYQKRDERIRVIHRQKHGWVSDARNDGISYASGEWITFVDSDDWLEIECYEKVFEALNGRDVDVFCEGGWYEDYSNINLVKFDGVGDFDYSENKEIDFLMKHLFVPVIGGKDGGTFTAPWNKIYKLDFLRQNSLIYAKDILYSDDLYFNLIVFNKAEKISGCNYIGYHYRQLSDSIMNGYKPDLPSKIYHFSNRVNRKLQEVGKEEVLRNAFYCRIMVSFWCMLRYSYFHEQNNTSYFMKVREIKAWKSKKIYKRVINYPSNEFLLPRYILVKQILKTPFIFPLVVLVKYKNWSEKKSWEKRFC